MCPTEPAPVPPKLHPSGCCRRRFPARRPPAAYMYAASCEISPTTPWHLQVRDTGGQPIETIALFLIPFRRCVPSWWVPRGRSSGRWQSTRGRCCKECPTKITPEISLLPVFAGARNSGWHERGGRRAGGHQCAAGAAARARLPGAPVPQRRGAQGEHLRHRAAHVAARSIARHQRRGKLKVAESEATSGALSFEVWCLYLSVVVRKAGARLRHRAADVAARVVVECCTSLPWRGSDLWKEST